MTADLPSGIYARPYLDGKLCESNRKPQEIGQEKSMDGSRQLDMEPLLDGSALHFCHVQSQHERK